MSRSLYRGVARASLAETNQGLKPKKLGQFPYVFPADGSIRAGDGAVAGESDVNAVLRHQLRQEGFPTSGVSTTPHRQRAEYYATHGFTGQPGLVIKIDRDLLPALHVREYVVADYVDRPSIPEDDEVILAAHDGGVLPLGIVVDAYDV